MRSRSECRRSVVDRLCPALGGVLAVLCIMVSAADGRAAETQSTAAAQPHAHPWVGVDVVVKDLFFRPRIGTTIVNPMSWQYQYHVLKEQDRWLWVTDGVTSGWLREDEVVPQSDAVDYYTSVILSHPYSASAYYVRGHLWADKGEPEVAIGDFSDAIKRDIKNAWAFHFRGNMFLAKRDYHRAIDDYSDAVRLNTNDAMAYNNRGLAWDHLEEYDKALADYDAAIRLDSHLLTAYLNRAGALGAKQLYSHALADYDKVIRLQPDNADAHARRAWILATSTDANVRKGGEALEEATVANSLSHWKNPYHLAILAAAHAELGQWDKAVEFQSKAIAALPGDDSDRKSFEERLEQFGQKKPARE